MWCKMFLKLILYTYLILNLSWFKTVLAKQQTVLTTHGLVSGKEFKTLLEKTEYHGFLGLPYAAPPLKDLRFLPPQDVSPWDDVLLATKEKPPCVQFNSNIKKDANMGIYGVEDCLYLDIFTPGIDGSKRAVIVFLYNEHFRYSYNKTKDYGPDFFIEENVVVATISHRLSIFGFLSFEDETLSGNSGLKDIVLGLQWIKDNIEHFGGDPNRITLMGHQGGAAAVDMLIHSKAKNLINAAIFQGGTSLSTEYLQENARERAFKLGDLLERSTSNSKKLLNELNDISAEELFNKELKALPSDYYKENQRPLLAFGPVVENNPDGLITDYPENLLEPINIPVMIGSNSREGLEPSLQFLIDPRFLVYLEKDFHFMLPTRTDLKFDPFKDKYYDAIEDIKEYYFKRGKITEKKFAEYVTYIGDVLTSYPVDCMARMYAKKSQNSIFYYHFDYYSELNENKNYILKLSTVSDGTWGASSGDELCYLFKCPRLKKNYMKLNKSKSEEIIFLKKIVKLWSNFAKHGNPTPEESNPLETLKWTSYNLETKKYLHISNNMEVKSDLLQDRFNFWEMFINKWRELLKEETKNGTSLSDEL